MNDGTSDETDYNCIGVQTTDIRFVYPWVLVEHESVSPYEVDKSFITVDLDYSPKTRNFRGKLTLTGVIGRSVSKDIYGESL